MVKTNFKRATRQNTVCTGSGHTAMAVSVYLLNRTSFAQYDDFRASAVNGITLRFIRRGLFTEASDRDR
jgi:hypothetical protein